MSSLAMYIEINRYMCTIFGCDFLIDYSLFSIQYKDFSYCSIRWLFYSNFYWYYQSKYLSFSGALLESSINDFMIFIIYDFESDHQTLELLNFIIVYKSNFLIYMYKLEMYNYLWTLCSLGHVLIIIVYELITR